MGGGGGCRFRGQSRHPHGTDDVFVRYVAVVGQGVDEVVIAAAILHHQLGLGHGQPVLGVGLVGVRVLAGTGDDRRHVDLVPADGLNNVPVDVRGRDDGDGSAGVCPCGL